MIQHSKHVFTVLLVMTLSVIAMFFWATAKNIEEHQSGSAWSVYRDPSGAFFFSLPRDLMISKGEGVLENRRVFQGGTSERRFTLETKPFSLFDSLNLENIEAYRSRQDLYNPEEVSVDGGKGLTFQGADRETRFVWFSYAGVLYQIESPRNFERTLSAILSTWQFSR